MTDTDFHVHPVRGPFNAVFFWLAGGMFDRLLGPHKRRLLADLPDAERAPTPAAEALPPTDLAWIVGSISIGVEREQGKLVVMLEELIIPDEEDEGEVEPARLRVHLTAEQVQAYAAQVAELMATSRPLCRLCDLPIDPSGHACPRLN